MACQTSRTIAGQGTLPANHVPHAWRRTVFPLDGGQGGAAIRLTEKPSQSYSVE